MKVKKHYSNYMRQVRDVIQSPNITRLEEFEQHLGTSRLRHSFNVSYKSFVLAEKLGWDSRAVARAGLMHDMFYYNFRDTDYTAREHCRIHPQVALENARRNFDISGKESDIIRSHMWLTAKPRPGCKEAYLVTMVDKYCATEEFFKGLAAKIRKTKEK